MTVDFKRVPFAHFFPDEEMFLDREAALEYALAQATVFLARLLMQIANDTGPSAAQTVELLHTLSDPRWQKDPELALVELEKLTESMDRYIADQKERHGVPEEVMHVGKWVRYGEAREIFGKCAEARRQMLKGRIARRVA